MASGDVLATYITDVEGNIAYFKRYVELSDVIEFTSCKEPTLAFTNPHSHFVFGGDLFDKGPGDIRLARMLVTFKRAFPERVFLLIGNRDVNKIKLSAELDESDLARDPGHIPGPFWIAEAKRPSLAKYYEELGKENAAIKDSVTNRLKYMLRDTMGSPRAFEFRREELALLRSEESNSVVAPANVSDEDVTRSFVASVGISEKGISVPASEPHAFVREYLDHAQAAVVLGNTLFVHGAIDERSMGFLPDIKVRCTKTPASGPPGRDMAETASVQEWIEALNERFRESLSEWKEHPVFDEGRSWRGGEMAMAYNHNEAIGLRTVMVSSFVVNGKPQSMSDNCARFLRNSGIHRVVCGHKPVGDSPLVIRSDDMEVIAADTSFSDISADDNRGAAVSEIQIFGSLSSNYARIHGVLCDGSGIDFALPPRNANDAPKQEAGRHAHDFLIGKVTTDGWWVKARLAGEASIAANSVYLLSRAEGRKVSYIRLSRDEVVKGLAGGINTEASL